MKNKYILISALFGALGIALGAFGAHALEEILQEKDLKNWHTACHYLQIHSLMLFVLALHIPTLPMLRMSFHLAFTGILLFSGSLTLYSLSQWKALVFFTPVGGLLLILAWLSLIRVSKLSQERAKTIHS